MGIDSQLGIDSQEGKSEIKYDNLLDYFNSYLFPLALTFGMTYEQFWYDDPDLFYSYLEAYKLKIKNQMQYDNQMAFIQGQYTLLALQQVLQFDKNVKRIFPSKPFDIFGESEKKNKVNSQLAFEEERKIKMKELATIFKQNRR